MIKDTIELTWGEHHPPIVIHLKSSWSGWNSWESNKGKVIWDEKDPETFTLKIPRGERPSLEEAILLLLAAGIVDEDAIKRRIVN